MSSIIDSDTTSSVIESEFDINLTDKAVHSSYSNGIVELDDTRFEPNIGTVSINNSRDVTLGNKTYLQGPVTIQNLSKLIVDRPTPEIKSSKKCACSVSTKLFGL